MKERGRERSSDKPLYKDYEWMSYKEAHKYELEAASKGVSEVARSSRGFMRHYQRNGSPREMRRALVPGSETQTWGARRSGFIKRHMAQYRKNKTPRRWLALVMWAYYPGKRPEG